MKRKLYGKILSQQFSSLNARNSYRRKIASKFKRKYKIQRTAEARLVEAERKKEFYRLQKAQHPYSKDQYVKAPSQMSFVKNTERVINFINKLRSRFWAKQRTFVDLSEVKDLEHDAIVVLLSIMIRFKSNNVEFNGNFPLDRATRETLVTSGYFDELYKGKPAQSDNYSVSRNFYKLRANRKVNAKQSSRLILDATKTVWGEQRRCQGVQTALIELMQNTNNHAQPNKPGELHCWISTKHYPDQNKVSFTLLDFGIGVFESLKNKPDGNKFFGWETLLGRKHPYKDNSELLSLILKGELHKTVTGHYFRGKGLPVLNELTERKQISDLVIVTNDVRADVPNNKFNVMKNSFHGTFVYWELNTHNRSSPLFVN